VVQEDQLVQVFQQSLAFQVIPVDLVLLGYPCLLVSPVDPVFNRTKIKIQLAKAVL